MSKIIISYHKDDSKSFTHRLSDFLITHFNETEVQLGLEGVIQPGDDFVETINIALDKAKVLLVVIGDEWLTGDWLQDEYNFDYVALKYAVEQGIQIFPVLMNSTTMPSANELPDSLAKFARRIGVHINEADFRTDAKVLVDLISQKVEPNKTTTSKVTDTPSQQVIEQASIPVSPAPLPVQKTTTAITQADVVPSYMEARYERQRKRFYVPPIITLFLMLLPWAVVVEGCNYSINGFSNSERNERETATVTGVQLATGEGAEFIAEPNTNIIILAVTCAVMLGVLFMKIDGTSLIMIILALIGSFFALLSSEGDGYYVKTLLAQGVAILLMLGQLGMAVWNTIRNGMIRRKHKKAIS